MTTFILLIIIICSALQNVTKKMYNKKTDGGVYTFTLVSCFAALCFFLVCSGGKLSFELKLLPYSVAFAASYGAAVLFSTLAIATGSLALTAVVVSCSTVVPSLYSVLFLGENGSIFLYIGIVLLVIALVCINYQKESVQISLKWIVCVFLAFAGNGICATVQKVQQMNMQGMYKNELMLISLLIIILLMIVLSFLKEKQTFLPDIKKGGLVAIVCGVSNGAVNLFVMILSNMMPASVMFPLISAGGIIMTLIIAMFIYKEKLSAMQKAGAVLGILSIVFLNL